MQGREHASHAGPLADTTRYGQWTGGTHPTGMHSYLILNFKSTTLRSRYLYFNLRNRSAWPNWPTFNFLFNSFRLRLQIQEPLILDDLLIKQEVVISFKIVTSSCISMTWIRLLKMKSEYQDDGNVSYHCSFRVSSLSLIPRYPLIRTWISSKATRSSIVAFNSGWSSTAFGTISAVEYSRSCMRCLVYTWIVCEQTE